MGKNVVQLPKLANNIKNIINTCFSPDKKKLALLEF
jgi:hypothetical protein